MSAQADTPAQTAKRQEKIDEAATIARQIVKDAHEAGRLMLRAETDGERKAAAGGAIRASKAAFTVAGLLADAGAVVPEWKARAEESDRQNGFDLNALASLDTPDTRDLLAALETAQAIAERVDRANERSLPDVIPTGPQETRGVDYAESIGQLTQRLRGEIFGGNGRD